MIKISNLKYTELFHIHGSTIISMRLPRFLPVEIGGPPDGYEAISIGELGKHTNFVVSFKLDADCHLVQD